MKLFTKVCLIAAAAAGTLGIMGVTIGLFMGGTLRNMDFMGIKEPHHIRQTDTEEIVVDEPYFSYSTIEHHNENLYEYSYLLTEIDRLQVSAGSARISIYKAEEEQQIVFYTNRKTDISKLHGSTLKIEDAAGQQEGLELELYLPEDVLKEIIIEADNCELTAAKMTADIISIDIDNASVWIDELWASKKAELKINVGDLGCGYYKGTNLEVDCDMGSMEINCEGSRDDYNYEIECDIGNVQIGKVNYSGLGNSIILNNNSEKEIEAECSVGEIILNFL